MMKAATVLMYALSPCNGSILVSMRKKVGFARARVCLKSFVLHQTPRQFVRVVCAPTYKPGGAYTSTRTRAVYFRGGK
jgi:hypothetical protein